MAVAALVITIVVIGTPMVVMRGIATVLVVAMVVGVGEGSALAVGLRVRREME